MLGRLTRGSEYILHDLTCFLEDNSGNSVKVGRVEGRLAAGRPSRCLLPSGRIAGRAATRAAEARVGSRAV